MRLLHDIEQHGAQVVPSDGTLRGWATATPSHAWVSMTDGEQWVRIRPGDGDGTLLIDDWGIGWGPNTAIAVGSGSRVGFDGVTVGVDANGEYAGADADRQGLAVMNTAIGQGARTSGLRSVAIGADAHDDGEIMVGKGLWWMHMSARLQFGANDVEYLMQVGDSGVGADGKVFGVRPDGTVGWIDPVLLPAAPGAQGPKGVRGAQGPQGAQGPRGPAGQSLRGNNTGDLYGSDGHRGSGSFALAPGAGTNITIPTPGTQYLFAVVTPIEANEDALGVYAYPWGQEIRVGVTNYGTKNENFRLFWLGVW